MSEVEAVEEAEPQVWYKKYTKGPKGNGFIANCANTKIDMLTVVSVECPEGYSTFAEVAGK